MEETSITVDYGGIWDPASYSYYSGGKITSTTKAGAWAEYVFYGTGIEWLATAASDKGIAKVYLDGATDPVLVDLYEPSTIYQKPVYKRHGLTLGKHTLRIEVTGAKSASSNGVGVNIDAFEVLSPDKTEPPAPTVLAAAGSSEITLTWTAPRSDIVGYRVYRNRGILDDGVIVGSLVRGESYTDRGLIPGVTYSYRVTAVTSMGSESIFSQSVTAVPTALGIGETAPTGTPGVGLYEENATGVNYAGTWNYYSDSNMSGGKYKVTSTEGATVTYSFEGTGIKWLGYRNNYGGTAEVRIDLRSKNSSSVHFLLLTSMNHSPFIQDFD